MLSAPHILLSMILLPLLGSFLNGVVIRPAFPKRAGVIATFFAVCSFACALFLFFHLNHDITAVHWATEWFNSGEFKQFWGFKFDALTAVMALVVTGIGSLIHLYSIGYMSEERGPSRYFAYLNLFLFNMLVLITSDNLLGLFVGWEGVGLCSYLLIGYWYEDLDKAKADKANTNIAKFMNNLESRIYAQISQNLATAMFASGGSNSGSLNFEGNTIFWNKDTSNVYLTVTDTVGNQTQITVPLGQFQFQ